MRYFVYLYSDGSYWINHKHDYIVIDDNGKMFSYSASGYKVRNISKTLAALETECFKEITEAELALLL